MAKVQAKFTDARLVFLPITLFILLNVTGYITSNAEISTRIVRSAAIGNQAPSEAMRAQNSQPNSVEQYAPVDLYHLLDKPILEADEIRAYEPIATSAEASASKDILKRDFKNGTPGFKAIKAALLKRSIAEGRDVINSGAETKIVFLKQNKWLCRTFYNPPDTIS
ncbi:MAG: hypothetical protein ACYC56_03495 [Candidatus Aquicultor sp.]